ncbi:MAG: hypothetical protein K2V38_00090, partial [Gemmataceae bacterium]|nr:hypothetical protein [Gemmataceae bacterium]
MLTLTSDIQPKEADDPARIAFSPDGLALMASHGNRIQVWPRWLDSPPRPAVESESELERVTLNSDGSKAFLYRSGNSDTDVLDVATGEVTPFGLPQEDPSWAHFDDAGGFFLVCRGEGDLVRYDYAPKLKKQVRKRWVMERRTDGPPNHRKGLGSHYRFGAICAPAGVFVGLEYTFGGDEPWSGLTVRSTADGSVCFHRAIKHAAAVRLLYAAGLTLAIHPSGRYFAYPDGPDERLRAIAEGVKIRAKLPAPKPVPKKT